MARSPAEIARALATFGSELSQKPLGDYARTASNEGGGRGRQAGVDSMGREPVRIYASSVLDVNTCPACYGIDGKEYGSVEESLEDFPAGYYIGCDGGARCRCTRVFVWGTEGEIGRDFPQGPTPNRPPAPAPGPAPADPSPRPRLERPEGVPDATPVSSHLQVTVGPKNRKPVDEALAAIDEVHGDGNLPGLPVAMNNRIKAFGHYRYQWSGQSVEIRVRLSAGNPHPRLTTIHEVGHFIDHKGFLAPVDAGDDLLETLMTPWATRTASIQEEGLLTEWVRAIQGSSAFERLDELARGARKLVYDGVERAPSMSHVRYLRQIDELWARSYAQYVATRSTDAALKAELVEYLAKHNAYSAQWEPEDFEPIAEAFDRLFERMGWRIPS